MNSFVSQVLAIIGIVGAFASAGYVGYYAATDTTREIVEDAKKAKERELTREIQDLREELAKYKNYMDQEQKLVRLEIRQMMNHRDSLTAPRFDAKEIISTSGERLVSPEQYRMTPYGYHRINCSPSRSSQIYSTADHTPPAPVPDTVDAYAERARAELNFERAQLSLRMSMWEKAEIQLIKDCLPKETK